MRKWIVFPIVLIFAPIILMLELLERVLGHDIDDPWWPWFKGVYMSRDSSHA